MEHVGTPPMGRGTTLLRGLSVVCIAVLLPLSAQARGEKAAPNHSESDYRGVTRAGGEPPITKQPPPGIQYVTWPGFRMTKEGATEVFLQLTGPVSYKAKHKGKRVDVELQGAQVYLRNNLRPIVTRHFRGPVSRFVVRELKGNALRLEITLARSSQSTVSIEKRGRYAYLVVRFPPKSR